MAALALVPSRLWGATYPLGTRRIPPDLLLLSWRLLQSILGRSAVLYRWRAAKNLPWRTLVSFDPPEHSSLLPLRGPYLHSHPRVRCLARSLVRRSSHRPNAFRYRNRHTCSFCECRSSRLLHARLPFFASPGGRPAR